MRKMNKIVACFMLFMFMGLSETAFAAEEMDPEIHKITLDKSVSNIMLMGDQICLQQGTENRSEICTISLTAPTKREVIKKLNPIYVEGVGFYWYKYAFV